MPSYRISIEIAALRPGTKPEQVLPTAERLLAVYHRVEDRSVELVTGGVAAAHPRAEIHLRFLVEPANTPDEDATAHAALLRLMKDLRPSVSCGTWALERGPGRNWTYLASGHTDQP